MSSSNYYCRWVRSAVLHLPDRIDFWSGMGGASLIVLRHFIPSVEAAMPDLEWQLLLWTVATIFAVRFVLAPYNIGKEDANKIDRQQKEIDDLTDKLKPRLVITRIVDETGRHKPTAG